MPEHKKDLGRRSKTQIVRAETKEYTGLPRYYHRDYHRYYQGDYHRDYHRDWLGSC